MTTQRNKLTCVMETRAGVQYGHGPLMSVLDLDYGYRLSESGDFNATVALADPRTRFIIPKSTVLAFYWGQTFLFRGIVEWSGKAANNAGVLRLTVRGRDLTGELAEALVGNLELTDGSGAGVTNGPALILGAANTFNGTTWTLDTTSGFSTTSASIYGKYSNENALAALVMAAQKSGEHWRVATDGTRKITWLRTNIVDSGVRCVQKVGQATRAEKNDLICLIQDFSEEIDAYRLYTRIYPYGAGDGDLRATLAATTRVAPAGFTLNAAQNYIESDNAVSLIGKPIGVVRRYQDIREIDNTTVDRVSASNQLYDAAFAELQRNDAVSDLKTFKMRVLKLSKRVKVGTIVTVEYTDQAYTVDGEQMVVLGIRCHIDGAGKRSYELTIAGVARWMDSVSREVVSGLEAGRLFTSHPQRGPNSYSMPYQKYVWQDGGDSETAKLRFRLGPRITQLVQVAFDFETDDGTRMLPLESTVRSVAGVSTTTSSGGSSTPTTSSGGSQTPTSSSGGGSTPTSSGGSSHNHTVTVSAHDHDVDLPDHTHPIPILDTSTPGSPSMKPLFFDITNDLFAIGVSGTDGFDFAGTADDGGSDLITSESGGGTTPTSSSETSHTHTVTISAHDHTVTISPHDHTVTIAAHTHDVTPNIQTDYGIYREGNSFTFNLDDLQFRVNSEDWADLSGAAVSLGGNWYRLDITNYLFDENFFPLQPNNFLEFRRKESGSFASRKSCMIDGQLFIDSIIQSVVLT